MLAALARALQDRFRYGRSPFCRQRRRQITACVPATCALYGCAGEYPAGRQADTNALAARATPQYSIVNRIEKSVNLWLNLMKILICTDEHMLHVTTGAANARPARTRKLIATRNNSRYASAVDRGIGRRVQAGEYDVNVN